MTTCDVCEEEAAETEHCEECGKEVCKGCQVPLHMGVICEDCHVHDGFNQDDEELEEIVDERSEE